MIGKAVAVGLCTLVYFVSANMKADIMYGFLSDRVDAILLESRILKLQVEKMDSRISELESNRQKQIAASHEAREEVETELPEIEPNKDSEGRTNAVIALRKIVTDEKKSLRVALENFNTAFAFFKTDVQSQISRLATTVEDDLLAMNASVETKVKELVEFVNNRYIPTVATQSVDRFTTNFNTDYGNLERKLETRVNTIQSEIERLYLYLNATVDYEQNTREKLRYVESSLEDLTANVSSVSLLLSSEDSNLSSRISSLASTLSATSSSLSSRIAALSARVAKEEEKTIAFSARLNDKNTYYDSNVRIVFNEVIYNYGSGYNSSSGIFTAPRSGTYLFVFSVQASSEGKAHVAIKVAGDYRAEAIAEGGALTGTNSVAMTVIAGEKAWIETSNILQKHHVFSYRTTFTGILID